MNKTVDLTDETLADLKTKAHDAGIAGSSRMKKDELIDALTHTDNDAIEILKADHVKVKALFKKALAKEHGDSSVQAIAQEIVTELQLHTEVEETIFYPALKKASERQKAEDAVDEVLEAYVEHDSVKALIAKIKSSAPSDESYKAIIQVMSEQVEHHVQEEETEMFKQAKKLLKREELEELGMQMLEKKRSLKQRS